jgi:hypothetical protein
MARMRRWELVALAAFFACVGTLPYFFFHIPAVTGDDFHRVYWASRWHFPQIVQVPTWLPLYSFAYGSAFSLGFQPMSIAHFMTALFSGASVWAAGEFAYELTSSRYCGWCTAIIIGIAPLSLWLSFSTLSEPMSGFLCFLCALGLFRWFRTQESVWLVIGIAACMLLTWLRFNGWPVTGLVILALLLKYPRRKESWVSSMLLLLPPLTWLIASQLRFGDPLASFHYYAETTSEILSPDSNIRLVRTFLFLFPVAPVALAVAIAKYRGLSRTIRWFLACVIFLTCTDFLLVWGRIPSVFPVRAGFFSGLFGLVLASVLLHSAFQQRSRYVGLVLVFLWSSFSIYRVSIIVPEYDREMYMAGHRLWMSPAFRQEVTTHVIGSDLPISRYLTMVVASGYPTRFAPLRFNTTNQNYEMPHLQSPMTSFVCNSERSHLAAAMLKHPHIVPLGALSFVTENDRIANELASLK